VRQLIKLQHMSLHDMEQLLDRYLKGETSPSENEVVEKWLIENEPESTEWKRLDKPARDQWMSMIFNDIQATIAKSDQPLLQRPTVHAKQKTVLLWRKVVAAAAILAVLLSLFLYFPVRQTGQNAANLAVLSVPVNQKKKITLDDGSIIWVNSLTELRYPKKFAGSTREVYLSGEAYFDIHHDASKPFIVHTGDVKTTVLGTAFNINASKNLSTVVVTVTRGKVSVADQSRVLGYIIPNQQLTYDLKNRKELKRTIDAQSVIAWQGDLYFDDITFYNAALLLQQRFNVRIGFANTQIKSCRFSGTALKGDNLDQILKVICAFNHAVFIHNADGSITIDGKGCN